MNRMSFVGLSVSFSVSSLILAFTLSWLVLAQFNFLYPVWHDVGTIGKGIDKFGPKNRYKPGFGDTSPSQRADLFAQINAAVHDHGHGLNQISYETLSSGGEQIMLREPEVVHLQDVANLLDVLKIVVVVNGVLWVVLACIFLRKAKRMIYWRSQLFGIGGFLLTSATIVLLIGPVKVFNQLHIWIFPKDNQWFFYYQDSLMSTLMLAPILFGWIAVALLALAIVFFILLVFCSVGLEQKVKVRGDFG